MTFLAPPLLFLSLTLLHVVSGHVEPIFHFNIIAHRLNLLWRLWWSRREVVAVNHNYTLQWFNVV